MSKTPTPQEIEADLRILEMPNSGPVQNRVAAAYRAALVKIERIEALKMGIISGKFDEGLWRKRAEKAQAALASKSLALEGAVKALEEGKLPLESLRLWVVEHWPDGSNSQMEYVKPRGLYSALDRWLHAALAAIKTAQDDL